MIEGERTKCLKCGHDVICKGGKLWHTKKHELGKGVCTDLIWLVCRIDGCTCYEPEVQN